MNSLYRIIRTSTIGYLCVLVWVCLQEIEINRLEKYNQDLVEQIEQAEKRVYILGHHGIIFNSIMMFTNSLSEAEMIRVIKKMNSKQAVF